MKILLVTEKSSRDSNEMDGGAHLVETLQKAFGSTLHIMQFGSEANCQSAWQFNYPCYDSDRFVRRLSNASFRADKILAVAEQFTHIFFVHISMQFGISTKKLPVHVEVWTFPMFLSPSYFASEEKVPQNYIEQEYLALAAATHIITPSHLEKMQLIEVFNIDPAKIFMVPRGINSKLLVGKSRILNTPLHICSVGSIKPQKNTLGLLQFFAKLLLDFPDAKLSIIGAVQNSTYFQAVLAEVQILGLENKVTFKGYVPPQELSEELCSAHIHVTLSKCETFGRAIFETLALGLPNIAFKKNNAAADYLSHLPYTAFVETEEEAVQALKEKLLNLTLISELAQETGMLFDDRFLSQLLISIIQQKPPMGISDFDGTLFHKNDAFKTEKCLQAFNKFPIKAICSARLIPDLIDFFKLKKLAVDWIIGASGAVVTNGQGELLWMVALESTDLVYLQHLLPNAKLITYQSQVIQMSVSASHLPPLIGYRVEIYQGEAFILNWKASKLHAVYRLLSQMQELKPVRVFGDGPYDQELLTFYDGTMITPNPQNLFQKMEVEFE